MHAIAIGAICTIIIVLYTMIGPKKPLIRGEVEVVGDRYIQIYSATWGINCNDYIDQLNEQQRQRQLHSHGSNPSQPLTRVSTDNALIQVGSLCNGKLRCSFEATGEVLGGDQITSCFKRLLVGYRCFTYDSLHQFNVGQGENITIDCSEHGSQ